jgi:PTH1 family peptidyl-tRNA hydrolase
MTQQAEITDSRQPTTESSHCGAMRLIVGLGNSGRQYDGTRHNIGFEVVDALARQHQVVFSFSSKWNADVAKVIQEGNRQLWLMKPRTLMNLSGTAVASFAHFFQIAPAEILVVLDDVMLSLGTIRLRSSGSSGGQRGLESVLIHFSTQAIPRLRLGIGSDKDSDQEKIKCTQSPLSDYVLGRFKVEELPHVKTAVQRALEAIQTLQEKGIEIAMNFFN